MPPPVIVSPVHLPGELASHCRPIRHEGPVLVPGTPVEVQVEGQWRPGVLVQMAYAAAVVRWA